MRQKKRLAFSLAALFLSINFTTACQKAGPAERAGERADEIVDNVKEGEAPLKKKKTGEKVGEAIDEALDGNSSK